MANSRPIQVRFPEPRYEELKQQAAAVGQTPSGFVRQATLEKLNRERKVHIG